MSSTSNLTHVDDDESSPLIDRVHVIESPPPNRFAHNFLPPPESNDMLVKQSLLSFGHRLQRVDVLESPFVTTEAPALPKVTVKYYIDEEDADATQTEEAKSAVPVHNAMKSKLEELFQNKLSRSNSSSMRLSRSSSAKSITVDSRERLVDTSVVDVLSEDELRERMAECVRYVDQIRGAGFFWRYHPNWEAKPPLEKSVCHRYPVEMWQRDPGLQFLVSAMKLDFPVGVFEPFFCSLVLYDLERRCRVSETFHFDLNTEAVLTGTLQVSKYNADAITLSRHAIFSVTERTPHVCLVLRIERGLQEDDLDPYLKKVNSRSAKELGQFSDRARMNMNHLPGYRQPFGWAVRPLFDDAGDLRAHGKLLFDTLYVQKEAMNDEQFITLVTQTLDPQSKQSPKVYPGAYFTLRIDELEDDAQRPTNRVDPSSILLADTPTVMPLPDGADSTKAVVREVLAFPPPPSSSSSMMMMNGPVQPFTDFVNLLYVYPEAVSLKHKNICVQMQVRAADDLVDQDGMKIIVGRSSGNAFVKRMSSTVNYHNKDPTFTDEMKIMLPLSLSTRVHLFFTFYHVNVKKKSGREAEEVIGYSVLPFYPKAVIIPDGTFDLRVAGTLPAFYMRPFLDGVDTDTLHFRNSGEPCFKVRLRLVSSVFSQNRDVNTFFQSFPTDEELNAAGAVLAATMLNQAVARLMDVPPATLVEFLPPFLDFLFNALLTRPPVRYHAFVGICLVVHQVTVYLQESTARTSLLMAYVYHRLDNGPKGERLVYVKYAQQWLRGINQRRDPEPEKKGSYDDDDDEDDARNQQTHDGWETSQEKKILDMAVLKYSWFHFEVLRKSLIVDRNENQRFTALDDFNNTFEEVIYAFVQAMYLHRHDLLNTKSANHHLALFFVDMFYVLSRENVSSMVQTYLMEFSTVRTDAQLLSLLCGHHDILFDSPAYLELYDPFSWELSAEAAAEEDVVELIRERFPIAALLSDLAAQCVNTGEQRVQKKVLKTLRAVFTKYDYDASLAEDMRKQKVANMFLPLVPSLLACITHIVEMDISSKQELLACVLWVLSTCELRVLRAWWNSTYEDNKTFVALLHVMELCVSTFKYEGYKQRKDHTDFQPSVAPESQMYMEYSSKFMSSDRLDALENLYSNLQTAGGTLDRQKMKAWQSAKQPPVTSSYGTLPKGGVSAAAAAMASGSGGGTLRSRRAKLQAAAPVTSTSTLPGAGGGGGGGARSMTAGKSTLRQMRAAMQKQGKTEVNTLTINSKDMINRLLQTEGAVTVTATMIVIDRFVSFVTDRADDVDPVSGSSVELCRGAIEFLVSLLQYPQTDDVTLAVYYLIRWFLHRFGVSIFHKFHALKVQVDLIGGEVFRHCAMADVRMRQQALALLYLLVTCSFAAKENLDALQGSLTIILSKMVPEINVSAASVLEQVIECLPLYFAPSHFASEDHGERFQRELEVLMSRLQMILKSQMEVIRQSDLGTSADSRRIEHMFMQIADAFSHVPAIRVEWLNRLAEHHAGNEDYAEAAQCYVAIAQLQSSRRNESVSTRRASDNPDELNREALLKAVHFLDQATLYEQAYECYKILLRQLEADNDWKSLNRALTHLAELTKHLTTDQDVRMFGTYYRVGFYGTKFGDLNGKEYVYKMPKITQLSEVAKQLTEVYTRQFMTPVRMAKNSDTLNVDELNADDCLLQVTYVSPYFDAAESAERVTHVAQKTNLRRFTYATPFTKDGKRHGGIGEQYQKVSVLTVEHPFPWLQTSQMIIERQETVLTPIENAVTDVNARTKSMLSLLSATPVDTKSLGGHLAGSVATQVNEGAVHMCKVFLGEGSQAPPEDMAKLRKSMHEFLEAMQSGLRVYRTLMLKLPDLTPVQKEFIGKLDEMFQDQCAVLEPLLKEPNKKRRAIRFNDQQ